MSCEPDAEEDDRPPICPACGVTMGIIVDDAETSRFVCLECGFSDDRSM
jgi:transposase